MREYGRLFVDQVVDVYDGDSFRCNIHSLPAIIGDNIGVRVRGIDTPEIRGKTDYEKQLAYKARDLAEMLLEDAIEIQLINLDRGKYFRILATVLVDGANLAESLIHAGLARPYHGGTKRPWVEGE